MIYLLKDEFIPEGAIRNYVNTIEYEKWFGEIDYLPHYDQPSLVCLHPHGIICTGILFSAHFSPGSTTLFAVSKWLFYVPFVGWLARHLGCIPATYGDIEKALKTNTVILVPGGVPELITGEVYTRRHGFLKIAKKANVSIVPVVSKDIYYDRIPCPLSSLRLEIAKRMDLPIMFPVLGYYGTWLPKRIPIKIEQKDSFKVKGDIEEERIRYFHALN
tara:strand:- start:4097 stop:4747 length:651 start_codon:yes stop_codon:yes gene_type:complete